MHIIVVYNCSVLSSSCSGHHLKPPKKQQYCHSAHCSTIQSNNEIRSWGHYLGPYKILAANQIGKINKTVYFIFISVFHTELFCLENPVQAPGNNIFLLPQLSKRRWGAHSDTFLPSPLCSLDSCGDRYYIGMHFQSKNETCTWSILNVDSAGVMSMRWLSCWYGATVFSRKHLSLLMLISPSAIIL